MATNNAVNTKSALALKGLDRCSRGGPKGTGSIAEWRRDYTRQAILEITDVWPRGTLGEGEVVQSRYGLSS